MIINFNFTVSNAEPSLPFAAFTDKYTEIALCKLC